MKILKNILLYTVLPVIVIIVFAFIVGLRIDWKKTAKLQAEKSGLALKDSKPPVYLTQEYPSSHGLNYRQSINLGHSPAVMRWQEQEQPFWVGIQSSREDKNYKNPILFLDFQSKVKVRVDPKESAGWVEMDPNFQYYIKLLGELQPSIGLRMVPLFVKFPEEGNYFVQYTISGDNESPTRGLFIIDVKKQ